jgi:enamine deaminase RidA (YjgF/YER057c/UK114 family)
MNTMARRYVTSGQGLPKLAAPISHAVVAGEHCYVSGQLATDAAGEFRQGSALQEAELAFRNVFSVLNAAGFSPSDLVFVEIAFLDLGDLAEINGLFAQLFAEGKRPARTVYQAAALPFGGKIKVQGIAVRQSTREVLEAADSR